MQGHKKNTDCNRDCGDDPYPGDRCTAAGWVCDPGPEALNECPEQLCTNCKGIDGTIKNETCACACRDDIVICIPL